MNKFNKDTIYVETPFGVLYATPSGDYDKDEGRILYPGIEIGLLHPHLTRAVSLAVLEATEFPSAATSFDPLDPALMAAELAEVPESRRIYDGKNIKVSPGLVLRSWQRPDEQEDEHYHRRTVYETPGWDVWEGELVCCELIDSDNIVLGRVLKIEPDVLHICEDNISTTEVHRSQLKCIHSMSNVDCTDAPTVHDHLMNKYNKASGNLPSITLLQAAYIGFLLEDDSFVHGFLLDKDVDNGILRIQKCYSNEEVEVKLEDIKDSFKIII